MDELNDVNGPIDHGEPTPDLLNPKLHTAGRIAGFALLGNSALLVFGTLFSALPANSNAAMSFLPAIIDFFLGISLARGNGKYLQWVLARISVGMLVWGGASIVKGQYFEALLQVAFCASLLLLLMGKPGRARMGVAITILSLFMGTTLLGALATTSFGTKLTLMRQDLGKSQVTTVTGKAFAYTATLPMGWYLPTDSTSQILSADADRFVARLDQKGYVRFFAEVLPAEMTAEQARAAMPKLIAEHLGGTASPTQAFATRANAWSFEVKDANAGYDHLCMLTVVNGRLLTVQASSLPSDFAAMRADFQAIFDSIALP